MRGHLVDAYVDPQKVAIWLDALAANPQPILKLVEGLSDADRAAEPSALYEQFAAAASPSLRVKNGALTPERSSDWSVPPPPLQLGSDGVVSLGPLLAANISSHLTEVGTELDAERFVANARAIAPSLLALQNLIGTGKLPPEQLTDGIRQGVERTKTYLLARKWNRRIGRPTTALIMSGGAANGAFMAGFVWRLTDILQGARERSGNAPGTADFDLVVGTSSGALVGVTVDLFATPGASGKARDFLLNSYTCSVESDLYCVHDAWDWKLLSGLRGLVRFDGVREKLQGVMTDGMLSNDTELVTVAVDYESGDIFAESDQDPNDGLTKDGRVDAVLASIVEPIMADPVDTLGRPGAALAGTFIDGGIRSELPVMEAVRRGAERVLVVGSSSLDPDQQPKQKNAVSMLLRTIDLLVDQASVGEIQQANLYAQVRRLGEYNVCTDRLAAVTAAPQRKEMAEFCKRTTVTAKANIAHAESAVGTFMGPDLFSQVAASWRSAWVLRPEGKAQSSSGYAFTPEVMRKLFRLGIETFRTRCDETLGLLNVPDSVRKEQCTDEAGQAALARADEGIRNCKLHDSELRPCKN